MLKPDLNFSAGYASRAYAESLSEFGEIINLPRSGTYLLKRNIPGSNLSDAMGSYPLFFCEDWSRLGEDLTNLPPDIISVALVADPFGPYTQSELEACFDVVNPFKSHYVIDLTRPVGEIGTRRHRKQARAAFKKMEVSVCEEPAKFVDDWTVLYQTLLQRHDIRGIRAFSKKAFEQQLSLPGMIVHRALFEGQVIGAQLFFQHGDVVHCHLGAVSELGYKLGAFYAMDQFSFEYFSGKAAMLDIGGGAGLVGTEKDGLSRYKKGWSSRTHPVYFCGRITNPEKYAELVSEYGQEQSRYFPAYRAGEFG